MWSLGCVLFVLLFGHCPFWAEENNLLLQLNIMSDKQRLACQKVGKQVQEAGPNNGPQTKLAVFLV